MYKPVSLSSLAIVVTRSAERALVNQTLVCPTEGHAVVLQLNNSFRGLTTHVVDSVLVTQPVTALHSVVMVPLPVIRLHVA